MICRIIIMQRPLLMAVKFELICREIYKFQDSLRDSNVKMDYLILPDKAEIPKGLEQTDSCILRVSATVMKKLSGLQSTDSVDAIALMKIPSSFFYADSTQNMADYPTLFASPHRILVLDGIQVKLNVPSISNILGYGNFSF